MISDFDLFISRARRFDICPIFVEQVPSYISETVTSSAKLKLAFNTQAEQVWDTMKLMGLNPEQAEALRELPVGRCVCVLGGDRWPYPMLLDTEKYHSDITGLSQGEINELCGRSMQDLQADVKPRYMAYEEGVRAKQDARSDPDALSPDECLALGAMAERPDTIESTCLRIGLDRQREIAARSCLMKKGHTRLDGSFGNKRKVYALTEKGIRKARELGYSVRLYKSGAVHEVILNVTERGLGVAVPGSWFKRKNVTLNGVQVDSLMGFPGSQGARAAIQVVCSKNYAREARNIEKLCQMTDLELVIVVSASRKIQLAMEKAMRQVFHGEGPGKIRSVNAEEILSPEWMWVRTLEAEDEAEQKRRSR